MAPGVPPRQSLPLIELDPDIGTPAALPDRVYATLKHRILTCSILPGTRIVEKELCAEMKLSRTPLREALNRLALEGLVDVTPFRGYSAAALTLEGFRELCEVRRILEAEAAAISTERATPRQLNGLESLAHLRYSREDRRTYERYLRSNSAFHQALVQCTGNRRLEGMVMWALDQHQRPLYLGLGVGVDDKASSEEHLRVVEAIRARDPDQARRVVTDHIKQGEERITTALKAAGY
jgi:DNA-binding GntR family transcriptional regulator